MPIYEYQCVKCRKVKELIILKQDDKRIIKCDCGSEAVRVISRTGKPQFKGSGLTPKYYGKE